MRIHACCQVSLWNSQYGWPFLREGGAEGLRFCLSSLHRLTEISMDFQGDSARRSGLCGGTGCTRDYVI